MFNCSSPGQPCIVFWGLSAHTALTDCPRSDNCFTSVKTGIFFNFKLSLFFHETIICMANVIVSGVCWSLLKSGLPYGTDRWHRT